MHCRNIIKEVDAYVYNFTRFAIRGTRNNMKYSVGLTDSSNWRTHKLAMKGSMFSNNLLHATSSRFVNYFFCSLVQKLHYTVIFFVQLN